MEMANHEIAVGHLPVHRHRGQHDAGQAADDEHAEEAEAKQHRRRPSESGRRTGWPPS